MLWWRAIVAKTWPMAVALFGRANGSDAKLHGQGPRAEATAARGALHVRRANARRVTPRGFEVPSRLGRRAEAGPCQLLRRVSPPVNVTQQSG